MPEAPITVVLADDHAVVRVGLRLVLESEPDVRVLAEAGTVHDAVRMAKAHRPDVLILDLNMPAGTPGVAAPQASSLDALPQLRAELPSTAIVILTMQDDPQFARRAMSDGASAYVLKESADTELVEAVRRAAAGESYLNPRMGAQLAAAPRGDPQPPDDLTARELEILRQIALGHTNVDIGAKFFLSVRTVESHRAHIQQKLCLTSRAELVRYALDRGLLSDAGAGV
jgi:two-component system response regulator NreC